VRLDVDADRVRLSVHNPGAADARNGEGLGVRGMEQRAELLGGQLRAGPDERGWTVEADVPHLAAAP
jgi:signal transduction histidine kinase